MSTNWIIVFEARRNQGIFRALRPGFCHCYGFLHSSLGWKKLDVMNVSSPMGDHIPVPSLDLMAALAASGASAIRITDHRDSDSVPIRLRLLTCVEIVKRLLNIRQATLLTPWQLFRHITGFVSPKN